MNQDARLKKLETLPENNEMEYTVEIGGTLEEAKNNFENSDRQKETLYIISVGPDGMISGKKHTLRK